MLILISTGLAVRYFTTMALVTSPLPIPLIPKVDLKCVGLHHDGISCL